MRRIIKSLLLVFLGLFVGVIAYEAIMLIRVSRLRTENPVTTSMIEARADEAELDGQRPKREQLWVNLDRISLNLQRAVLAGEDTGRFDHIATVGQEPLPVVTAILFSQGTRSNDNGLPRTHADKTPDT